MVVVVDMASQLISSPPHMMDGSVIEDLGGGAFSSFLGKETKINKHIYVSIRERHVSR